MNRSNTSLPEKISLRDSHIEMTDEKSDYTDEERADYLASLASSAPNVNDAVAIVIGNFAVVGIDIDGDVERGKVGTIKYSVTESLRHDPLGAGAIVIADPDLNARLKEVQEDFKAGRPIRGILNELADIVGRIMPEVPLPEDQSNPEDSMEKQNEETDTNKNKLKEKQKDHSKE